MNDSISRQAAIDALSIDKEMLSRVLDNMDVVGTDREKYSWGLGLIESNIKDIEELPSAQSEQRWIPFEIRPLTDEEKEEHPEWDCILDCKLPDDGQRILVTIRIGGREEAQQDEFYSDDGSCSYLDSGYEIGTEAVAWMPMPEPWKGKA